MSAANMKQHTTTTTTAEVRRPANGSFSGNDAVGDILEKLPSRATGAESCNIFDDQTVESNGSKQIDLCLETPCEEDADDGYAPLDGSTNSRSVVTMDPGVCEKLTGCDGHPEEKKLEPQVSHSTREQKEPEASHSGVRSGKTWIEKKLSPIRGDYSMKKVKRVSVGAWASVSFSHIGDTQTFRFITALRNECVKLGMDLDPLPIVSTSLKCTLPAGLEKALRDLYKNIKKFGTKGKEMGLLIVILPDTSDYKKKVEEVCYELGVACHCLLPCDISQRQHLRAAHEIYSKVSDGKDKDGDSSEMDEMDNFDEMSSDSGSSEIYSLPEEMDSFEQQWGALIEHKAADISSDIPVYKMLEENDKPWFLSSNKRTYADLVEVKVESIEMYWACVSFSYMDGRRLLRFLVNLQTKLKAIGMDFSSAPIKIDQVRSGAADIRNSLFSSRDSVSELFTKLGMKGEQIRLFLVIMPEDRGCHAEIDEVCKSLGVVYQCCLLDAWKPSEEYVEKTAHQIKFKVEQKTMAPLMSEVPTIFIGADISPGEGSESLASVAASVDWPKATQYRAHLSVQPPHEVILTDLFRGKHNMIRKLLDEFCWTTGKSAERMIFFRHGIIDASIANEEICALKLHFMDWDIKIKLTHVVVTKKRDMECEQRSKMTIKSTRVQHSSLADVTQFEVLCNHSPATETSKPVYYRVVFDENNLTADVLQSIIIKLSRVRDYKAYPQISMVPPAHYAYLKARSHLQTRSSRTIQEFKGRQQWAKKRMEG